MYFAVKVAFQFYISTIIPSKKRNEPYKPLSFNSILVRLYRAADKFARDKKGVSILY